MSEAIQIRDVASTSVPLHQSVANIVADKIRRGEWAVGDTLPSEFALCAEYGVSRHTLRHALRTVEEMGLILRRQGAPTRVISQTQPRRFTQDLNSPADILRYGRNTYRINEVEEFVRCDEELERVLHAPIGSSWFHIGAVRREQTSNVIIAWTDMYVLPEFSELVHEPDHTHSLLYEQIERKYGISIHRAEVDIYSTGVSPHIAKSLQVPKGTPCLVFVRRYYDTQGRLFEATITHHPEGRFVYTMEYRHA